jgi:hypothetical protein
MEWGPIFKKLGSAAHHETTRATAVLRRFHLAEDGEEMLSFGFLLNRAPVTVEDYNFL